MVDFLFCVGVFYLILGAAYPICATLFYPFYKLMGGKQNYFEYMRVL